MSHWMGLHFYGLTIIMRLHFHKSYENGVAHFWVLRLRKFLLLGI